VSLRQIIFALPVVIGLLLVATPGIGLREDGGIVLIVAGVAWWALRHMRRRYREMTLLGEDHDQFGSRAQNLADSMRANANNVEDLARDLRAARMRSMDAEWRLRLGREDHQ
jgi:hypothetical protein